VRVRGGKEWGGAGKDRLAENEKQEHRDKWELGGVNVWGNTELGEKKTISLKREREVEKKNAHRLRKTDLKGQASNRKGRGLASWGAKVTLPNDEMKKDLSPGSSHFLARGKSRTVGSRGEKRGKGVRPN